MLVGDAPQDADFPAVADAAGVATVTIRPANAPWLVSQVSIEMPSSPAGAACTLRKDGAPVTALIPTLDAAGGDPPITLHQGQSLTVQWTGLTAGSRGRVFVVYQVLEYGRS